MTQLAVPALRHLTWPWRVGVNYCPQIKRATVKMNIKSGVSILLANQSVMGNPQAGSLRYICQRQI